MKPFAQVPARTVSRFIYQQLLPKAMWSYLLDTEVQDPGGGGRWHSTPHTRGVEEGVNPQHPTPSSPPISLSLSPYLVALVQGLEWAATGLPLPGGSHSPVFCSCKKSEKNQQGWNGSFPHALWRCPSCNEATSPEKRQIHLALGENARAILVPPPYF